MVYLILPVTLLFLIPLVIISGIIMILRKVGVSSKKAILVSFLIFGLLIGCFSFWEGTTDFVAGINFPGSATSEIVYNKYLLPYWKQTLEPIGYQEIPIINIMPPSLPADKSEPSSPPPVGEGKVVGTEVTPIYDFPLKKVSDLYIPASIFSWGLLGLLLQLAYNGYKWIKR